MYDFQRCGGSHVRGAFNMCGQVQRRSSSSTATDPRGRARPARAAGRAPRGTAAQWTAPSAATTARCSSAAAPPASGWASAACAEKEAHLVRVLGPLPNASDAAMAHLPMLLRLQDVTAPAWAQAAARLPAGRLAVALGLPLRSAHGGARRLNDHANHGFPFVAGVRGVMQPAGAPVFGHQAGGVPRLRVHDDEAGLHLVCRPHRRGRDRLLQGTSAPCFDT